jgi:hypothetical protein
MPARSSSRAWHRYTLSNTRWDCGRRHCACAAASGPGPAAHGGWSLMVDPACLTAALWWLSWLTGRAYQSGRLTRLLVTALERRHLRRARRPV